MTSWNLIVLLAACSSSATSANATDAVSRDMLRDDTRCDRFGILATRTKGHFDIACELDGAFRWNGREYVLNERSSFSVLPASVVSAAVTMTPVTAAAVEPQT